MNTKRVSGLNQIVFSDSEILVLGTFPSEESRKTSQYYTSSRNRFWQIINRQFNENKGFCSYNEKIAILRQNHIALWDVIASKQFTGESSDEGILLPEYNDLRTFLNTHSQIKKIIFNGRTSEHFLFVKIRDSISDDMCVGCTCTGGRVNVSFQDLFDEWRCALTL